MESSLISQYRAAIEELTEARAHVKTLESRVAELEGKLSKSATAPEPQPENWRTTDMPHKVQGGLTSRPTSD
jgi:hypothetical protein